MVGEACIVDYIQVRGEHIIQEYGVLSSTQQELQRTMVNLFETVLARRAEDVLERRKTSKWDSRWRVGVWLGKTEVSDERLLYSAGEVTHHRKIRRFAENDPRRWQKEEVLAMKFTPWYIKETAEMEQKRATGVPVALDVGERPGRPALGAKGHILPQRQRPLTPSCAACSRRDNRHTDFDTVWCAVTT